MRTALQVADQIQQQMETRSIPAGALLGTEADLCTQHGVGLGTLRRAVRILEQREVAVMRRGANGGLFAAEPSIDATANHMTAQWERSGASRRTIMRDAMTLRGLVLRRAHERMTPVDAARIAALHAKCRSRDDPIVTSSLAWRREHAIGQLTGNPVVELGYAVTMHYQRQIYPFEVMMQEDRSFGRRTTRLVDEKISALIRGDVDAAIQASNEYVSAYIEKIEIFEDRPDLFPATQVAPHTASLPMRVCRAVLRDIRKRGWQPGECLGREPDLLDRYQVSRNTWRQALSILFEYSAVESRRGGGGGIYVAPFNAAAAREAASVWLARQGCTAAHGRELIAAIAPFHIYEAWSAAGAKGSAISGGQVPAPALDCGALLAELVDQGTSPLLNLAVLPLRHEAPYAPAPLDITDLCHPVYGADLIKRAILGHFRSMP